MSDISKKGVFLMFRKVIMSAMLVLSLCSSACAHDVSSVTMDDVDVNQAFRVYDKTTGELILDCGFEPVHVCGDGYEYVIMTVCDMHGNCAAYEFSPNIILEKLNPEDIIR